MKQRLQKFLASIGLSGVTAPAESADEAQFANALDSAETAIANLKKERDGLDQDKQKLTTDLATANTAKDQAVQLANTRETELTAARGEATTTKNNLTAERKARAKLVIQGAIVAGRVPASELDAQTTLLANAADFDAAVTEIEKRPAKLNTSSRLGDLGPRGQEQRSNGEQIQYLVNCKMEEPAFKALPEAERYRAAWKAVEADAKHAALFANMKEPAKKS